ncbi:dihydrodipicolinate synthetase [Pterulicium gracile]|uniref:Dihydrodipicolinate synthetase n=1 Tax=Pterulicium gracile TaxID=1884261 RepID=A0A5C3Q7H3_9AGAR|nr:dihydrodipicolinate synthetase [Pterula gracilis]
MAANVVNGVEKHVTQRTLHAGIYAPIPTFFLPDSEDLDIPSYEAHVVRVASAGVGPLLAGSMGEAVHLSPVERITLIKVARKALDTRGLTHVPLIVGTGAPSLRETHELTKAAADAGADAVIVIASGYFAGAMTKDSLKDYFLQIAKRSPVPVMLYNFPAASGGIDLDSELISELALESTNICGIKLTCGNVGKLTRIADVVAQPSFQTKRADLPTPVPFLVLGGFIDFLTPSTFANGHGAITGLANVAPHAITHLFELSQASRKDLSKLPEALRLQGTIARADYAVAKIAIPATKFILEKMYGYGGVPRKPLAGLTEAAMKEVWENQYVKDLVALEREISGKLVN